MTDATETTPAKKTKITLRREDSGIPDSEATEPRILSATRAKPNANTTTTTPSFDVTYGGGKSLAQFGKNPFVPLGAFATAMILAGGLFAFRAGNSRLSQRMMQARVLAQGATLAILSFSVARVHYAGGGGGGGIADKDVVGMATATTGGHGSEGAGTDTVNTGVMQRVSAFFRRGDDGVVGAAGPVAENK